jgi:hypothetical protein
MWSLSVNAFAGQVDQFGFTGIVAGFGYRSGGSFSATGGALIGGIPVAQMAFASEVMGNLGTVIRTGAFQFFNQIATTFSRASLPDVGAGPPPTPGWRTPANLSVLDSLDPYLANLAAQHLSKMETEGLGTRLIDGFRSYSAQSGKFMQGRGAPGNRVTNARGGESLHNFGLAYDVGVFDGKSYVEDGSDPRYLRAGELGESVSDGITDEGLLEWGGRWRTPDMSHFQFGGGLPVHTIRERYEAGAPIFSSP